jgi:hypothetical protein
MITNTDGKIVVTDENYTGSPKKEGQDNHAHEPREAFGTAQDIEYQNCIFIANGASESLKLSAAWRVKVVGGTSYGGVEDCVDIVKGGDITFDRHQFVKGPARQCVTLKGGARRVRFIECKGLRRIVIGDYSKYDAHATYPDGKTVKASPFEFARPGVREVYIQTPEGEPLPEVLIWHGDKPDGGEPIKAPECITKVYFWIRSKFREAIPADAGEFVIKPEEIL